MYNGSTAALRESIVAVEKQQVLYDLTVQLMYS